MAFANISTRERMESAQKSAPIFWGRHPIPLGQNKKAGLAGFFEIMNSFPSF
jgi:hypothetical protein